MYNRWRATITLLYGLTLLMLLFAALNPAKGTVSEPEKHINRQSGNEVGWYATAQNSRTTVPERQQPLPSKPEKAAEGKEKTGSPEGGEKKAPLKDFVPSEKIQADKAVDFPADI